MSRRPLNRRELRAAVEAAEARGLISPQETTPRSPREPANRKETRPTGRLKVVWHVCDVGGRTVATFPYSERAAADQLAARLKAERKGNHFVRSEKVPILPHED
jgi:hypothetical protein